MDRSSFDLTGKVALVTGGNQGIGLGMADFGPIAVCFASDANAYHSGDTVIIDGAYACF